MEAERGEAVAVALKFVIAPLAVLVLYHRSHEVFSAWQHENVAFLGLPAAVFRESLVRFACDGKGRERPSQAKGAVSGPGVVRQ